jgi:hypothetical protein
MENHKTIEEFDHTLEESFFDSYEKPRMKNVAFFFDDKGNLLLKRENLVVMRGRVFALEKVFDLPMAATVAENFSTDLDRKVCLFKIGTGGTPLDDPFNPNKVKPLESDLSNSVPFRTLTVDESLDDEVSDLYQLLSTENAGTDQELRKYFAKKIGTQEWFYKAEENKAFIKVTLKISAEDARDQKVNELGLFLAKENEDGTFSDSEMFSRITFHSESLENTKAGTILYYVFV